MGATRSGDEVLTTAARLRTDGIRFVRVLHSDPYGRARSKELPVDAFPGVLGGLGYCEASLVEGLDGEPLMDPEFPGGQGFPDVHAVPDPATLRVAPWQPDTAWMLADLRAPDGPSALCCRGVLARQVAALEQRGLRAVVASEPEFYLVREDADGAVTRYSPGTGMAYTTGVRADPDGVLRRIHEALDGFELGVTTANREFSPGQFEINLSHSEALDAADRAFLLEEIVKDVAAGQGLLATFMAKPFAEHEGSSHHVHVSLWEDDDNAFARDDGGLSELATAFARRHPRPRAGVDRARVPDRELVQAACRGGQPGSCRRRPRRRRPAELPADPVRAGARDARRDPGGGRVGEPVPADRGDPRRRPRWHRAPPRSREHGNAHASDVARRRRHRAGVRRCAVSGDRTATRVGPRRTEATRVCAVRALRHRLGVARVRAPRIGATAWLI